MVQLFTDSFATDKVTYYEKLLVEGLLDGDVKRVTRIITLRADKDLELIRNQFDGKHKEKLYDFAYNRLQWMASDDYMYRKLLRDIIGGNEDLDTKQELSVHDQTRTRYILRSRLRDCKLNKTVTCSSENEEFMPYY